MQLIRRLKVNKVNKVFVTEEKLIYVTLPVNSQKDRVWSAGRKRYVNPQCISVQRATFSVSLVVSAVVSYGGKGSIHLLAEKTKINADFCSNNLLPELIENCNNSTLNAFIFQQYGITMLG